MIVFAILSVLLVLFFFKRGFADLFILPSLEDLTPGLLLSSNKLQKPRNDNLTKITKLSTVGSQRPQILFIRRWNLCLSFTLLPPLKVL